MTERPDRGLDLAVARLSAAVESGDPNSAASALGHERGTHGIGIGQALYDLETVHRIVTRADPSPAIVRTFADAWAEAAVTVLLGRGAIDQRTGLGTIEFLATRLRDLARAGEGPQRSLVVVRSGARTSSQFGALMRSTRIASTLARSFPGAETPVGIADRLVVAVVPIEDAHAANVAHARIELTRIDGVELLDVALVELPTVEDEVRGFVVAL